ncbi:MAG: VTT domain-containing protein [Pseudomonadota bacterium]
MKTAKLLRGLLLIAILTGVAVAVSREGPLNAAAAENLIASAGTIAPLLFVLGYAIATVLFMPGSVLTLAAGALFGPVAGAFYSLTGATLGATLAFLVARFLAGEWVARKAGGKLRDFVQGVEAEGWRFVAFVRLVPLFPFNLVNYALGLTRIPLVQYVLASYLCMLPGAFAYAYLGFAGREAATGGEGLLQKGLIALALLATAAFLPRLVMRLRRPPVGRTDAASVRQRAGQGEIPMILDVRGLDEYHGELGHIPGALNIPLTELAAALPRLEPYRDKGMVLVCRTDKRSLKAAELLASKGFRGVEVLDGGMEQWHRIRFPVNQ